MNKVVAILFTISCFATSWISGIILGVGMWFWIIIASGVFVSISQFLPIIRGVGAVMAGLMGIISIIAVLLGLLAATTGGSFDFDDEGFLLLLSFCFIAMFGFALVIFNKSLKLEADITA